jgi:hypothetical protein
MATRARWRPADWVPGRALPIAVGVAFGLLLVQGATAVLGRSSGCS